MKGVAEFIKKHLFKNADSEEESVSVCTEEEKGEEMKGKKDKKNKKGKTEEPKEDQIVEEEQAENPADEEKKKKKELKAKDKAKKKDKKKKKKEKDKEKDSEFEIETDALEETIREEKTGMYFANRELSWLKFNTRVLEEAENLKNPFCERMSFLSIYQSNLDEFFMVRFGSLYDQMLLSDDIRDNKTNMTCEEQLVGILKAVKRLGFRKDAVYADMKRGLENLGVQIYDYKEMNEQDKQFIDAYFENSVRPTLSPQVVGRNQPFPFLNNKEIYAVAVLTRKNSGAAVDTVQKEKKAARFIGIVPCQTNVLPRLVKIPGHENRYMLMEELILHFIPEIFNRYNIISKSLIRVIRNADIDPDEEMYDNDSDFRAVMEKLVQKRTRLMPVKIEYSRLMEKDVLKELGKQLALRKRQMFHSKSPLDLSFLSTFSDILRNNKELFFPKFSPKIPAWYNPDVSMFDIVREKDRLLFYPYESIDPFLKFLNDAATDPEVESIKMTLYRVARNSKVIEALVKAAENGKKVLTLVELRARFDEENNIEWSRALEEAGVEVIYGLDQMKVHSKLCLITRRSGEGVEYFTQIGTGNYNEKTAKQYTDFCLMTAAQDIGAESENVFAHLVEGKVVEQSDILMVAPKCLRDKIIDKIDRQIVISREGGNGYVGVKINSLTDKVLIEKLVEASKAGVRVDMVVRGACCLIGQIPEESENILIRSIVGRYLEHSRIYIFGMPDDREVYISSADFMTRNTTRRVEVGTPVRDPDIKARICNIFDILLKDNVKARLQRADGEYVPAVAMPGEEKINAMKYFEENDC